MKEKNKGSKAEGDKNKSEEEWSDDDDLPEKKSKDKKKKKVLGKRKRDEIGDPSDMKDFFENTEIEVVP